MKRNVLEYLEASAERYPGKIALVDEVKTCTYAEFLAYSRKVGSQLAARIPIRRPVAVLAEKGVDILCTFMGIVQAGCFYSLLNPEFPLSRLEQIVSVLKPALIITDADHREMADKLVTGDRILMMEELLEGEAKAEEAEAEAEGEKEAEELLKSVRSRVIDTDPLYANFTSGSTGVPKGVLVSHRSVLDFIDIFAPMFGIDHTDVVGNQAPFDFDVSVKDIYSAMKTGAELVIIPKRLFSMPSDLLDFICDHQVTTMIWAVSALCLINTFHGLDYRTPDRVKRILFSGEVMPAKHLKAWMDHLPEAEFVNLYGPTEITCNCTYHRISRQRDYAGGIPVGKPFPNEDVFLLGEDDREVTEPGVRGEICVRGSALALGYFGNREQTDKAFPINPLNPWYPERIYRTGDLGSYNEERELVFCGRKDFQIKYKGHRIELEEIERAISAAEGVERCCVLFQEAKQKLYGFYTGSIDKKQLHAALKETLPVYMIPGILRKIESFPLTKNGKIDRKRLLEEA